MIVGSFGQQLEDRRSADLHDGKPAVTIQGVRLMSIGEHGHRLLAKLVHHRRLDPPLSHDGSPTSKDRQVCTLAARRRICKNACGGWRVKVERQHT